MHEGGGGSMEDVSERDESDEYGLAWCCWKRGARFFIFIFIFSFISFLLECELWNDAIPFWWILPRLNSFAFLLSIFAIHVVVLLVVVIGYCGPADCDEWDSYKLILRIVDKVFLDKLASWKLDCTRPLQNTYLLIYAKLWVQSSPVRDAIGKQPLATKQENKSDYFLGKWKLPIWSNLLDTVNNRPNRASTLS